MPDLKEITIEVTRFEIPTDPSIEIFGVEIGDGHSAWMETIPSEETLRWFFRGLQAGAQIYGNKYVALPEIPTQSVSLPKE